MKRARFGAFEPWHLASRRRLDLNDVMPIIDAGHLPAAARKDDIIFRPERILDADGTERAAITDNAIFLWRLKHGKKLVTIGQPLSERPEHERAVIGLFQ